VTLPCALSPLPRLSFSLQSLKPEYAKAATALKAYDADIVIGKVRSP
jgi:hypothetical protein